MLYERFLEPNTECGASIPFLSMASSLDGIRLHEDDHGSLFATIVTENDVANLRRYVTDCGLLLFSERTEYKDD